MRKLLAFVALLASLVGAHAQGTTSTFTIVINGPLSTSITCTPSALTAPVAPGTIICPLVVSPTGWSGLFSPLTGANASSFSLSGSNLVVGSTALAAGSYSVTVTATP